MTKLDKLLRKILNNARDVSFDDLIKLIKAFGFKLERTKGSRHIFSHQQISELINIQNVKGKAKPYQVKQFIALIERHNIKLGEQQ